MWDAAGAEAEGPLGAWRDHPATTIDVTMDVLCVYYVYRVFCVFLPHEHPQWINHGLNTNII